MNKHSFFLLVCLISLCSTQLRAYNLKQIADKERMSNSSITSLCQDEKGAMWIGSCDGLNVYNGRDVEPFKPPGQEDYLSGNLIDNILYTGADIYWIQTYYGLNRLDRETNKLTCFNEFQKQFFMNKDKHGTLFVIKESNCIHYYHKDGLFKKIDITGMPFSDIITFFIDEQDLLWIVMKGYSRCYSLIYNPDTSQVLLAPKVSEMKYAKSLLYCYYEDNQVYYIDKEYRLFHFDVITRQTSFVYNLENEIRARGKISAIVKHHDDVFISFVMDGVIRLEKQTRASSYKVCHIPINSGVFCLKKDRFQDLVWIGTDGQGLYIYSHSLYSIKSTTLRNYKEKIERPVRALFWDDERTFWVGTKGDGILKIYDYDVNRSVFELRTEKLTTQNSELESNAVYCFGRSHRNVLWIGSEEGLSYYSYREKKVKRMPVRVNNIDFRYIHDVFETTDSELWLTSVGLGVVKARIGGTADRPVLEDIQQYTINDGDFSSNYFFSIFPEDGSRVLFSNKGYGVFRFNMGTNGLEPVATNKYNNMTLNNVLAIHKDSTNNYLFGTSLGLIKYASEASYQVFNASSGFQNSTIHSILKSSPFGFWLSTNRGLIRFDSERNVFRSYGFDDGLGVVEFSDGAAFSDKKTGILFFGGINGFVSVQAEGKREQPYMPPVYFNKLSIFGEQHNLLHHLRKRSGADVIRLRHDQNFFSISFNATDYLNGNSYVYYYKLKGLSDQWVNNGSSGHVSFTNMAPGEYTLLVKYYNSAFDKEGAIYSILIRIGAPWCASAWAYLFYALCLLAIVGAAIRSYMRGMKHRKQEMLNEIEREHQQHVFESKLRFFTNIAHEFCTPLALIYGPCGRILASKGVSRLVQQHAELIQANAERLNNLIHELIEFRRIETGNRALKIEPLSVGELSRKIAAIFAERTSSKRIDFQLKIVEEELVWNTDKGFLTTILINLVSNAFKYTADGKGIRFEVGKEDGMLLIRVANQGKAIREEDFEQIFNRYVTLDNFEKQDDKRLSRNGLGLAISYNMSRLLQGSLKVENAPEGWVLFTLALPHLETSALQPADHPMGSEYIPALQLPAMTKLPDYKYDETRPSMLLIDGEVGMHWFIGELFSDDFNVIPVLDTDQIERVLGEISPAVIICEQSVSGGGIEWTRRLKAAKETAHIPVIIVSGEYEMDRQMSALSAGAEMYITKPFNGEYLRISVFRLLERKETLKSYFRSPLSSFEKAGGKLVHKDSRKFLQTMMEVINENIRDKNLTPSFIADRMAISPRSLYRKIGDVCDESPADLIRECRLQLAKDLLLSTKKTIDEIVFEAGFTNKVTFFKVFRNKYDCTPKEYRTKHVNQMKL